MDHLSSNALQNRIDELKDDNKVHFGQSVGVSVDRNRGLQHKLEFKNIANIQLFDKDGKLKEEFEAHNSIKNAAKDTALGIMFHGSTPIDPWYIGLIDASGWTTEAASDTLASHSGWVEFTNYTGNRQQWTEGATSAGSITNSTPLTFPITATGSLKGIFIASAASGTSGTLWSTIDFPSPLSVLNGDSLKIQYTMSL